MNDLEQMKYKVNERIEEYKREMYLANVDQSCNILYYQGAIESLQWVLESMGDKKVEVPLESWGNY
jgi:hypothetical protein